MKDTENNEEEVEMSERIEKQIRDLEARGWIAQDIAEILSLPIGEVEAEMIGPCEHGFLPHQECRFCISDAEEADESVKADAETASTEELEAAESILTRLEKENAKEADRGSWRPVDRFKGAKRIVFKPSTPAGPAGAWRYGRKIGVWNDREILVVWDDEPGKIALAPAWNERMEPADDMEEEIEEPPSPSVRVCTSCGDGFSYPDPNCPDCGGRGEIYG